MQKDDDYDAKLLSAVADGDSQSMRACVDRFAPLVWAIIRRSVPEHLAADVAQETFVSLWQSSGSFDPNRGRAATFVAVIARRRIIDLQRRKSYEPLDNLEIEPVVNAEPVGAELELDETNSQVAAAIQQLSPPKPMILRLAFFEGMTHATISEHLQLPLGTVKSHIQRGLAQLKSVLVRSDAAAGPSKLFTDPQSGNATASNYSGGSYEP